MTLTGMRVTSFAGGGLLGVGLYIPISFLFQYRIVLIGVLLILVRALLVSPWSIYDVAAFIGAQFRSFMEKQEQRKQERFIKREEEKVVKLKKQPEFRENKKNRMHYRFLL